MNGVVRLIELSGDDTKLMKLLVDEGVDVSLSVVLNIGNEVEVVDDDGGGGILPNTVLVDMTSKEAYKWSKSKNGAGVMIMQGVEIGFRADAGDRLQVVYPAILADGGNKYYQVWNDAKGEIVLGVPINKQPMAVYINKAKTERVY